MCLNALMNLIYIFYKIEIKKSMNITIKNGKSIFRENTVSNLKIYLNYYSIVRQIKILIQIKTNEHENRF